MEIQTASGGCDADFIINCAGLHCDRLGRKAGVRDPTKIVPFRGEYYKLKSDREHLVRPLSIRCPILSFPFWAYISPASFTAASKLDPMPCWRSPAKDIVPGDFSLRDMIDTLTCRGFWRFLLRYPSMCWDEFRRSFSKDLFCLSLQRFVPEFAWRT